MGVDRIDAGKVEQVEGFEVKTDGAGSTVLFDVIPAGVREPPSAAVEVNVGEGVRGWSIVLQCVLHPFFAYRVQLGIVSVLLAELDAIRDGVAEPAPVGVPFLIYSECRSAGYEVVSITSISPPGPSQG